MREGRRVLLLVSGAALAAARATTAQQPETPLRFAAEASLVAVDVSVVDGRGRPVPGLSPEDFKLTVDGRPRRVVSAELVALGTPERQPEASPEGAGYSSNAGATRGRLVMIVVDQGSIRAGLIREVTLAADHLLDRLTPADHVGVMSFPLPGPNLEPTADQARVRDALARVVGRATSPTTALGVTDALALDDDPSRWRIVEDQLCPPSLPARRREECVALLENEARSLANEYRQRSRQALHALEGLFNALGRIEGQKTVVLISQGMLASEGDVSGLGRAAALARVSLFLLRLERDFVDASQQRPSTSASDDRERLGSGLDALADGARGAVFTVAGAGEGVFDRIASELSAYYLLGFEPEEGDRNDKDHEIRVKVGVPGVSVRSRRSLRIAAAAAVRPEEVLGAVLRSPFGSPDVPMRVTTWSTRGDKPGVRVLVGAEIGHEGGAPATALAFVLLDAKGKVVASGFQGLQGEGRQFLGAADVAPGRYTLKLAALDARGRTGSLERTVEAALTSAGGLEFGDLLLASGVGEHVRPAVAPEANEGRLTALLELSSSDPVALQAAEISFEVSDDPKAPALVAGRVAAAAAPSQTPGRRVLQAGLSVQLLPPGDYVARAVVSAGGAVLGQVTRPFRIPTPKAAPGGAPERALRRLAAAELLPVLPRFDRNQALRPDLVGYVLDRMEVLAGPPSSREVALARAHAREGRYDALFDDLEGVTRDGLDVALLRGLHFFARGELRGAEAQLKAALGQSSELVVAAILIGACEAASGRDAQAVGAWKTALTTESDAPVLRTLLGEALLRTDAPEEAAALLEEEAAARPAETADRSLGLAYAMLGRADLARRHLSAHLERSPDDQGALFVMIRLAFDSYASGAASDPFAGDRERLLRYARAYVAAKSPQHELVARWLRHLEPAARSR